MNRTCKRCGLKQSVEDMHYSKKVCGYLCNDRQECNKQLTEYYIRRAKE